MRFISQLLNIRANEWPRLSLLYIMIVVFMIGWTWSASFLEASFLAQLGVAALPWFFSVKAVLSVPAVALYTAFADRVAHDTLLVAILALSVLGVMTGLILLSVGLVKTAYPFLYLLIFIPLDDIFWVHWYTYVNGFFDTRSAKRILPVLSTSIIIGGIIAGLSMPVVSSLPAHVIMGAWIATLVAMGLFVWFMPYLLSEDSAARRPAHTSIPPPGGDLPGRRASYVNDIVEGYRYVVGSAFLRWMALSTLLVMMLLTLLEYQTSRILLNNLQTTARIASFIGIVIAVSNFIILPFQLFLLGRIIGRIGIGSANLIFPVGNLIICGSLILSPGMTAAALAYFNRARFYNSTGYLTDSLLYNAVPLRVTGRARAFIGGLIFPIGALVGSGILLLSGQLSIPWLLPFMLGVLAVIYLYSTIVIRKKYAQALLSMLEEDDFLSLVAQANANLQVALPLHSGPQPSSSLVSAVALTRTHIEQMIQRSLSDPVADVRLAAQAAGRLMDGMSITDTIQEEERVLSTIERITFLKGVPFFQGMSVEQLKVLAAVCEEQLFPKEARIFNQGDPGGTLYVIVSGQVAIEQEKRKGSFARLTTIAEHSYFGEESLFDESPHAASAIALKDTLTLRLQREPLIALARQHPDLSLELINVLSQRLREANARVAELTRTMPRQLHKLFDQYE